MKMILSIVIGAALILGGAGAAEAKPKPHVYKPKAAHSVVLPKYQLPQCPPPLHG